MIQQSDEKLYLQILDQQGSAFKVLYDRYAGPLFRFIYRFTVNKEVAEEILHEVFLQLISGTYKPNPDSTLKSWLYTIAKNKSLNHLKKSSFEIKDEIDITSVHSSIDLESQIIDQNLLEKIAIAEDQLPMDLKQTWSLRKQGFDYQKIAESLAIPIGTVKSRYHRLVEHLRKELKNER